MTNRKLNWNWKSLLENKNNASLICYATGKADYETYTVTKPSGNTIFVATYENTEQFPQHSYTIVLGDKYATADEAICACENHALCGVKPNGKV